LSEVQRSELMMVFQHCIERAHRSLSTMETTIRTKQYGGEITLPNLTSEAGAKTYGPPCT
jgi:hypothetical protein